MVPIRALLIDLDDTLLDEQYASRRGFEALVAAFPTAVTTGDSSEALARWRAVSGHHWRRFEKGEWTFQQQRRARARDFLNRTMGDDEADAAWAVYGNAYEAAWTWVPGAGEFLARTAALPRVLVTNGQREQQKHKLAKTGLAPHFPHVVTPADAGAWKPEVQIFRYSLDLLEALVPGVAPQDVLMIGDDLVRDIEPARALGLQTWHAEPGNPHRGLAACSASLKSDRDGQCYLRYNPV